MANARCLIEENRTTSEKRSYNNLRRGREEKKTAVLQRGSVAFQISRNRVVCGPQREEEAKKKLCSTRAICTPRKFKWLETTSYWIWRVYYVLGNKGRRRRDKKIEIRA